MKAIRYAVLVTALETAAVFALLFAVGQQWKPAAISLIIALLLFWPVVKAMEGATNR